MAKNQIQTPYDDAGFPAQAASTTTVTLGGTVVVKPSAGRLLRVIVTTVTASAVATIYDNASTNSGPPLMVIPIAAAVGTIYNIDLPAVNGITIASSGATGAVTIGYA
jgi:hypothetical protein